MSHLLSPYEAAVLESILDEARGAASLPDLAVRARLSPSEVRRGVDGLAHRGLVEANPAPSGSSATANGLAAQEMVALTDRGRAVAREIGRGAIIDEVPDVDEADVDSNLERALARLR
jgi:hypothetical protein